MAKLMIEKARLRRISSLALPMIAAALSTNVMTFVDTLMVAQLGNAALGGVGIAGQLFFLLLAVALGLTASVQAMVARRVGEGRLDETGKILNAGLLLGTLTGLVLTALGYLLGPLIFAVISSDPVMRAEGLAYLSTRMPSLVLMALTITFRSYWVGVSEARYSMIAIVSLSIANALFNYMLIFGNLGAPELGVRGAGLGSTLAVFVALLINIAFGLRHAVRNNFLKGLPRRSQMFDIVKVGVPESARQVFFSVGVVLLYVLVGQIGTRELAAFHVVVSVCLLAYMPHIGIGGAATTLVGEALGRRDVADASAWGWQVSNTGFVLLATIAFFVAVFPQQLLELFFADQQTLAIAVVPLQLAVFAHVLDGYGKIYAAALVGAGATRAAMLLTVVPQYLLLLPLLAVSVLLGYGLDVAMLIFLFSAVISVLMFTIVWYQRGWSEITL